MIIRRKGYNLILASDRLTTLVSKITGFNGKRGGQKAMGYAIFPCIILLRSLDHPMTNQWINHESIHIRQSLESFGLIWVYSQFEYLYFRIIKKYSHVKAYRYEAMEQEAYLNQHNGSYLKVRPIFNTVKYMIKKTPFYTDDNYKVILDNGSD